MTIRPPSLRRRLLAAILAPLALVLALSGLLDYRLARDTADAAFDQSLADTLFDLSHATTASSSSEDVELEMSTETEAMLRSSPDDRIFFAIIDHTGKVLAGDKSLPILNAGMPGEPAFYDALYSGELVRVAVMRSHGGSSAATIAVAETVHKRHRASGRILAAMALPVAGLLIATLLAVYFGVQRGLAPLADVERDIARRSARDLQPIDLSPAPREIRPLLARLNDLLGLLRDASQAQQRFLAGAAHQLRTPLAGLQTQVELATHEGRFDDSPERRARIDEAIVRMTHLVQQLLVYAQAEPSAALSRQFEVVDLRTLVEQSASLFLDQALARGIDLGFEPSEAVVQGVPWMLREALSNLIDNALRYTPAGGEVTVACAVVDGRPRLSVIDNGPGLAASERERVFERFYRVPGAPGDGCGLGLAIVKEIAEVHGADVRLGTPAGGGLRVELVFPPA